MVVPVKVTRTRGLFHLVGGLWPLMTHRTFERVHGPYDDDGPGRGPAWWRRAPGRGSRGVAGAGRRRGGSRGRAAADSGDPELLATYLNDHLAGSSGGVSLIRRMARAHRGRALGPPLESLADEVAQDRRTLRRIMSTLGVPQRRHRVALGRVMERAGRLKLNGRLFTRSPLSDVLELEAMRLGVEGKEACWRSLRTLSRTDSRLDPADLDALIRRARRQARALEAMRTTCVAQTLATP
ncbi:hypothetical protein ACIPPS_07230 [Streptomyces sp. NPDC090127]|uniref:hypothetical protein n=1 Tax=Streptomyces sp. NPDC090127 TaxID=3365953 RepID=UPI0037FE7129